MAARWDARQRVGGGCQGKRREKRRRKRKRKKNLEVAEGGREQVVAWRGRRGNMETFLEGDRERQGGVGTSFVCLALVSRTTGTSRNGPDQSSLPRIRTQVQDLRTLRLTSVGSLQAISHRLRGVATFPAPLPSPLPPPRP